jgi:beta-glucosidase
MPKRNRAVNRSLERLFTARFRLGMFDPPERVPFSKIPYSVTDSDAHRAIALEAARESIVLLKNEKQTLPITGSAKTIAVIGPSADDTEAQLGNYNGFSLKHVSALEGIRHQFQGKASVTYALGATYTSQTPVPVASEALAPPKGTPGRGLLAEYFDNAGFAGKPVVTRVEARPYVAPNQADPALAAVTAKPFAVRWSGRLTAPVSGDYLFQPRGAEGPQGMHMYVDGKDLAGDGAAGFHAQLLAGHVYPIRIDLQPRHDTDGGSAQVVWMPPAAPLLAEAVSASKKCDVTVLFVGLSPSLEGEEMPVAIPGFSGGDRTSLDLPEAQERLVEAVVATGKPVVVVLTTGSALAANFVAGHAAAVLEAWYGGEEAGTAIAETLAGVSNPAGRLPVTFYKDVKQLPPFDEYAMKGRTYRYFTGEPLWGFGYGLSYSKFAYSDLTAQRGADAAHVTAKVRNDSARAGDEVVQLYVNGGGGKDDPIRQLRGFERVHLNPHETRTVTFTLPLAELPVGKVRVDVGGGQPVGTTPGVSGQL